jgi:uncharacterized membrane protein
MSRLETLKHTGLHRPRLLAAAVWGVLVWLVLPDSWSPVTRALVSWNIAVWPYLLSMAWLMLRAAPARVRAIAEQEDASSAGLVAAMSAAAVLSVVGIVALLARGVGGHLLLGFALPILTVTGSWFLVGVIFTFHYAHMFYEAGGKAPRPLRFPEGLEMPSYRDFLYFSFTISAAVQTSDVTVVTTPMRSAVLAHSVLSFFFNLAILGLSINIAAAIIGAR